MQPRHAAEAACEARRRKAIGQRRAGPEPPLMQPAGAPFPGLAGRIEAAPLYSSIGIQTYTPTAQDRGPASGKPANIRLRDYPGSNQEGASWGKDEGREELPAGSDPGQGRDGLAASGRPFLDPCSGAGMDGRPIRPGFPGACGPLPVRRATGCLLLAREGRTGRDLVRDLVQAGPFFRRLRKTSCVVNGGGAE